MLPSCTQQVTELQAALNQDRKARHKMNSRSLAALHNLNEAMLP